MECSRIRDILFENADTEIPPEVRETVEAHLAGCPSCARQRDSLQVQMDALRSLPKTGAPRDFLEQVRRQVERPSAAGGFGSRLSELFGSRRFLPLAGAAVAAVLVILVSQVGLREDSPQKALVAPAPPSVQAPALGPPPASVQAPASEPAPSQTPSPAPPSVQAPASRPVTPEAGSSGRVMEGPLPSQTATPAAPAAVPRPSAPHLGVQQASVAITLKLPGAPAGQEAPLSAPAPRKAAGAMAPRAPAAPSQMRRIDTPRHEAKEDAAKSKEPLPDSPAREVRGALSEVGAMVLRRNGKVLSTGGGRGKELPEVLAEIPAESYPMFLDDLRGLGEVGFNEGGEPTPIPPTNVRVTVKLDARP